MSRSLLDRHKSLLTFATSVYVWGSLSPGSNMERFLTGRYWELLPNYNPLAFAIAAGIVAVGFGIAYVPDLVVRIRRGSSRRMAEQMFASMNTGLRSPVRVPMFAVPSSESPRPPSSAGDRTIGGGPAAPSGPAPRATAAPPSNGSSRPAVVRLDAPREGFREDVRSAFGFVARPIEELIQSTTLSARHVGLTEPSISKAGNGTSAVNYLGVCFTTRDEVVKKVLDEFEEIVRDLRIRLVLPTAIDLSAYLEEHPRKSPVDALRAYVAATQLPELESNQDGPSAPVPIARLAHDGFIWESRSPVCVTWREIAAFTATVRGARKARPSLPAKARIPATDAGPHADLEAALDELTRDG